MTDMPKVIMWSRWQDPLGRNQHEFEYAPEEDEDENDDNQPQMGINPSMPAIVTPVGVIPIQAFNDPTKVFNFWMGDTNFNISRQKKTIINSVPGVEVLDVFTRYKFRVGIGKCFKVTTILEQIQKALGATPV